ncbi:MAG: pilus (MSHA type) biogenesis protein MshL [Spongiibacteraceae bacterium]
MNPLTSKYTRASFSTIALLLAACQANPPVTKDIDKAMREPSTPANTLATNGATVAPPPAVNAALLPSETASTTRDARSNISRFDISVKDADATDFFMGLVEGTPYNMLVQPGVGGKITMSLKNVSVPEVMEAVRNVYGYDFTYRNGIFEVMPGGMATRFFPIDYLNLKRMGMSRARVNSGQLAQSGNGSSNTSSSNNSNGTNSSNVVQIPSTEINTDTEADVWVELQTTLKTLVGEGDGKQVVVSPQTGMVVVRAPSRELSAVEDFLKRAQLSLERQVILEAKIIEVTLDDGFQSGINWSKLGSAGGNPLNIGLSGASLGGATPTLPFGTITPTDLNPLGGVFSGTYSSANFDGAIELLKTQGSVQVLSSPRVSTVNNQKAVIKVGSDEFFVTAISSNSNTTSSGTTTTPNVTLTPFFSGIALDVTPQISEQGQITLHVHPSVTQVTDQQKQLKVFDQDFELPLAYSTSRETDTIVRAKNGQVVVIGGLMQNKDDTSQAGAPVLADVPVLGYLFKQKRKATTKSELVILLRPIVPNDAQWEEQVSKARERMDDMHPPLKQKFLP